MNTLQSEPSHNISLAQAIEMTTLYRSEKENILDKVYRNQEILCYSETFNRQAFEKLLAQPRCTGIRMYYSMDTDLKLHLFTVGVNEKNEDILPNNGEEDGGIIIEEGVRCPPNCLEPSPLCP